MATSVSDNDNTARTPSTKWGQSKSTGEIIVTIKLADCRVTKKEIQPCKIHFEGVASGGVNYKLEIDLFGNVNVGRSRFVLTAHYVQFRLKIADNGSGDRVCKWKTLNKSGEKVPGLSVDFDFYNSDDEDDVVEDKPKPQLAVADNKFRAEGEDLCQMVMGDLLEGVTPRVRADKNNNREDEDDDEFDFEEPEDQGFYKFDI